MNPSSSLPSVLNALPPYFGGKRRFIPWIFQHLTPVLPPQAWAGLTFIDGFLGGGSVSLYAKTQGFDQVLANDLSDRSQLIGTALLGNTQVQISKEDGLYLTQPRPAGAEGPGFIETHYAGSVLSRRHARALGDFHYWLATLKNPAKQALCRLLLWHLLLDFFCFPTSIGTSNRPFAEALDGLREWDRLNPKRFLDESINSLLKPTWSELEKKRKKVNTGVFRGAPVTLFQQDAYDFVAQAQGDILYLDPPYPGTLAYEKSNRVLDSLLFGELPLESSEVSPFSKGVEALIPLLASSRHIPYLLLSYGNHQISLQDLIERVKAQLPDREVQGVARSVRHLAYVSKSHQTQELLILASPKKGVISCP